MIYLSGSGQTNHAAVTRAVSWLPLAKLAVTFCGAAWNKLPVAARDADLPSDASSRKRKYRA